MNALTTQIEFYAVMNVIELLRQGQTFSKACRKCGIHPVRFRNIVQTNEQFRADFADAEVMGRDALADALVDADELERIAGTSDPAVMKMMSTNIQWLLSKRGADKFGERIVVENHFTADQAIIEALDAGKRRAIEGVVEKKASVDDAEDAFVIPDMSMFY